MSTEPSAQSATLAFTEWLDENERTYLVVVLGEDHGEENILAARGNMDFLEESLTTAIVENKTVRRLFTRATLSGVWNHLAQNPFEIQQEDTEDDDDDDI